MAKRRNRKNRPNIPQSTLDRARLEAGLEPEGDVEDALAEGMGEEAAEGAEDIIAATETEDDNKRNESAAPARRRRRRSSSRNGELSVDEKKNLGQEAITEMLHNPTKTVPEEQLRKEYTHVIADLRNMFMLAGALIAVLIFLAQVL